MQPTADGRKARREQNDQMMETGKFQRVKSLQSCNVVSSNSGVSGQQFRSKVINSGVLDQGYASREAIGLKPSQGYFDG